MSYGSGKYWRGETDRVLYIHFFYFKIEKKMGGKEKEKTDCELRRVRHAIKATRAGRFLGVSVWVRLTSNPVHVRCHDCPGPWLPLQVEGWLSCRWRCRSSTAAAVCVGKWWIDQYETDEARCLKETVRAHSSPPERRGVRGCFLGV